MDISEFIIQFQDYLAPKLDTYEQAIYLYIFRHSRLLNKEEITIGFKSARKNMAFGIGENGKPMSESTTDKKVQSLQAKGCIKILGTERNGRRLRLSLPSEILGLITASPNPKELDIDNIDFFEVSANRALILDREGNRCFYCLRNIDSNNYVIEHVVSRPIGDNSYRNLVAACLQCNNRKGPTSAEDFMRTLYREGFLSTTELEDRLSHLEQLKSGKLKPILKKG
jgi:hypothetical protein